MTNPKLFLGGLSIALSAPRARYWSMVAFVVFVFLLGGGSRYDIVSLSVLRPVAFGFLIYAFLVLQQGDLRAVRVPFALLCALIVVIAVQLLPVPPSFWQALPGRELYAQVYASAGIEAPWLPLTLSPSRTLNSLMSLVVPLAAIVLFAIQEPSRRPQLMIVLWLLALFSAMIGIFQFVGSSQGALYFYRITNNGLPVGLFANRNHQALFVSIAIMLAGYLIASASRKQAQRGLLTTAAGGSLLVLLPFLLVAGSRAGLLIGLTMVGAAAVLVLLGRSANSGKTQSPEKKRRFWLVAGGSVALLFAVIIGFVMQSRALALDRLLATGDGFELRGEVWPVIVDMAKEHWFFGTGFGTFEIAYKQIESTELLRPAYLNQAHQDWVQLVIEGGLATVAILIVFVCWIGSRVWRLAGEWMAGRHFAAAASALIVFDFAIASLVDYPLRVPSLMLVFALACAFLSAETTRKQA